MLPRLLKLLAAVDGFCTWLWQQGKQPSPKAFGQLLWLDSQYLQPGQRGYFAPFPLPKVGWINCKHSVHSLDHELDVLEFCLPDVRQ